MKAWGGAQFSLGFCAHIRWRDTGYQKINGKGFVSRRDLANLVRKYKKRSEVSSGCPYIVGGSGQSQVTAVVELLILINCLQCRLLP